MEQKEYVRQYPHLAEYRDWKPMIDENIKKVEFLLSYQKTYFSVQGDLKPVLFRLTDEKYLERITASGNHSALKSRNQAMPYKDIIVRLINDIDAYEAENKKLLAAVIRNGTMDSKEFGVIYPYLYMLAEDDTSHSRIPSGIEAFFCENTKETCCFETDEEYLILYYLMLGIKAKGRFYFEYPHIADALTDGSLESAHLPYRPRMNFLKAAGDYYETVCDRKKAMLCYRNAALIARENRDWENAAYSMQKYYRLNNAFPQPMQEKADVDSIRKEYRKYADIVLQGVSSSVLKADPVEFTDGFSEQLIDVMRKTEAEIDRVGDLHVPYQRWILMQKYFAERDISWKTPKEMNPNALFD